MAKRVKNRIRIRNLTNFPQPLNAADGDVLLVPPNATVPINPKFMQFQKLNPAIFKELTAEQSRRFGMTVHRVRGQHAQVQANARRRITGKELREARRQKALTEAKLAAQQKVKVENEKTITLGGGKPLEPAPINKPEGET